jgi:DtxR family Mn-dependent transcriptional regulator
MENHNSHHAHTPVSESEQMYLLATLQLAREAGDEPVPIPALAQALAVQPVSANQMIHSLEAAGLVEYLPYRGVQLTPTGQAQALRVQHYRTLWKTFLVEQLGMPVDEAGALACDFEHHTTESAAERLRSYLAGQNPDPPVVSSGSTLANLTPGETALVAGLPEDKFIRDYLVRQGVKTRVKITLLARGAQGDVLLQTPQGALHLSAEIAGLVEITPD